MEIENLLIYGLGFRKSAYITEEFLKQLPQHRHNYRPEVVIDGHILERRNVIHMIFKDMFWDKFGQKNYINCNQSCFKGKFFD